MKRTRVLCIFASLLLISLFFVGCAREADSSLDEEGLHQVVFHAGWAPETKTVLQEDGSVWWSPGDEISVFVKGHNKGYRFTSTNSVPAAKVDFTGSLPESDRQSICAIYPYDESSSCVFEFNGTLEQQEIHSTVPSVQYVQPGAFSNGQMISVASLVDDNLYFYNVCGGIKFSVVNEGINKVVFTSRKYDGTAFRISGEFKVGMANGTFLYLWATEPSLNDDGASKITVYPTEGDCFVPGEYYYVAMIPGEVPCLEMTFYKGETIATYFCSNIFEWGDIKRAHVKRLLDKDKDLSFVNIGHKYARMSGIDMWPFGVGVGQTITEVNFNTCCETLKGKPVYSSFAHEGFYPVYAELNGTVVNFYTEAEYYMMDDNLSFSQMSRLKELDLSKIDIRNLTTIHGMFMSCESLEKVDLSNFNTSKVTDMSYMFYNCRSLEQLDLSSFSTANVSSMYHMFGLCTDLKSIDLCNAAPGQLNNNANAGNLFYNCKNLTKVDLGRLDLSGANCEEAMLRFAKCSNNCAVLCTPETRARLCEHDTQFISEDIVTWYVPGDNMPDVVEPIRKPELYYSSDFSMDKKIKLLNKATEGAGIDIILVGEAYSDRLISDGTYENDMKAAMENIFSVEPMKTYRNLFNVYMIYAVSMNEVIDEDTAFDYYNEELHDETARFGEHGQTAYFDVLGLNMYSNHVIQDNNPKHLTRIIVVHDNRYEGFAMVHPLCETDDEVAHDCPTGIDGIAVVHKCESDDHFKYTVCHEFGHAFAALYEEYVDRGWEMPSDGYNTDNKAYFLQMQNQHGWWNNIDFTSDPLNIRWHRFIEDPRYDDSNVSIIEGARYAFGVWRSMNESIMASTYGQYSVPAREAFYKIINKLAWGDSWQYDFEAFVLQDLKNLYQTSLPSTWDVPYSVTKSKRSIFKMERSVTSNGKEVTRIIMK